MKKNKIIKYRPKSYRLHEETVKRLSVLAKEENLSFNLLILRLLDKYDGLID